jgi:polar amino acid transport system substrate-binding protein
MMSVPPAHSEPLNVSVHPMATFVEQVGDYDVDGIVVRRLQEAFCRMDQELELKVRPWKRAYYELEKAEVDALAGVLKNPEREKLFDFSENHILKPRIILAVRHGYKELTKVPDDLSILATYTMDYVRGYSLMGRLDAVKGRYIPAKGESANPTIAAKKLIDGRFDVLIADEYVLSGVLAKLGASEKVTILKPSIQEKPSYVAFPKALKLKNTILRLDKALESMKSDGSYEQIADDYLAGTKTKFKCDKNKNQ